MKLDQYKLQTAMMECGKAHFRIAQQAGMSANTLRRIEREADAIGTSAMQSPLQSTSTRTT